MSDHLHVRSDGDSPSDSDSASKGDQVGVADAIVRALALLDQGQVIAFPTETVYGLAVAEANPEAKARLAALKGRDPSKPIALLCATAIDAVARAGRIPARVLPLIRDFWPGPLTLVTAGRDGGTVGLRVPAHPIAEALLDAAGGAVLVTSANRSGEAPLTSGAAVREGFTFEEVPLVIDAGKSAIGEASTVVKVSETSFSILRQGSMISAAHVKARLTTRIVFVCTGNTCRSPMAAALLQRRLGERMGVSVGMLKASGFDVLSAGTSAGYGGAAATQGVQVMQERGLDTRRHQSQPIEAALMERATLVVPLSPSHEHALARRFPQHRSKIEVLDPAGVPDPIGGSLQVYRDCADHIDRQLEWIDDRLFGDVLGHALLRGRDAAAARAR